MLDQDDVQWLLVVALIVAAVVAGLAWYANHLEGSYADDMDPDDGGKDGGPQPPDQPPVRYHAQVLAQAAVGFYVSLFFALVGFVLLVDDDSRGLASAIVAIVLAIVFFVESRRSRTGMLEKTLQVRAERIRLIELVTDEEERNRLISELLQPGRPGGPDAPGSPPPPPGQ